MRVNIHHGQDIDLSLITYLVSFKIPKYPRLIPQSIQSPGGGSSTASSRDASPCRDLSPLINSLNAPIIVRRGPRGFGFTIRAIRVYFGDTDIYTVHHLVMEGGRLFSVQPRTLLS